jgi:predicted sulfurtransferase
MNEQEYMCEYCEEVFTEDDMYIIDEHEANKCEYCYYNHEAQQEAREARKRREQRELEYWRKRDSGWNN